MEHKIFKIKYCNISTMSNFTFDICVLRITLKIYAHVNICRWKYMKYTPLNIEKSTQKSTFWSSSLDFFPESR